MLRTTLASTWSRKRRLIGTVLAIVLGVAFLTATLALGDSARAGFATAFREANAGTDAVVRSGTALTAGDSTRRPPIPASTVDLVASVDGVAEAVPTVEGTAQVIGADGEPIGGGGPPTIGEAWIDDPALAAWDVVEGAPPAAPGEVVVDRATARNAGVGVGDRLTVLTPAPIEVEVAGIVTFAGGSDSLGGVTYVGFTLGEAQQLLLGTTDAISGVIAAGEPGLSQDEVAARVRAAVPDGTEVLTGDELTAEQEAEIESDFLGFFTTALLAFAVIALVVAAFSIVNTFSILSAQRSREWALLRAVGASRRQVIASAMVEAGVVGVVGALVGVVAGIGVATGLLAAMEASGFGLPTDGLQVGLGSLATGFAVGVIVTVAGASAPAWRSSRIAPLAAVREIDVDRSATSWVRVVTGVLLSASGAALVLSGAADDSGLPRAGLGALALLVGLVMLGPVLARPVVAALGAPLALRGTSGDLARRNAMRNPKRTAGTSAALLVGVGVVTLFTVFGASVSASLEDEIDRSFGGDLVVAPDGFSGAGIAATTLGEVAALDQVDVAAGLGFGPATIDGRQESIGYTDPHALASVVDLDLVEGDLSLVGDRSIALHRDYASDHELELGDVVEVGMPDGASEQLEVAALYEGTAAATDVLVPVATWTAHTAQSQPPYMVLLVELADGVSLDEGKAAVERATEAAGSPPVMDRDEYVDSQAAQIDAVLTVVYALLVIAVLIALMGIANTMSLSIHERTRELGLLRAVGQTRRQLRAMVRWEAVLVALLGSVGGVALGLFLGWGVVRALNAAVGFGALAVPTASLAVVLVVGAAAGALAGWRPARRAARLDVLTAVATE